MYKFPQHICLLATSNEVIAVDEYFTRHVLDKEVTIKFWKSHPDLSKEFLKEFYTRGILTVTIVN